MGFGEGGGFLLAFLVKGAYLVAEELEVHSMYDGAECTVGKH